MGRLKIEPVAEEYLKTKADIVLAETVQALIEAVQGRADASLSVALTEKHNAPAVWYTRLKWRGADLEFTTYGLHSGEVHFRTLLNAAQQFG